eukprot:scaffold13344_cov64-Phaeocystis_antarctica.AAC.5
MAPPLCYLTHSSKSRTSSSKRTVPTDVDPRGKRPRVRRFDHAVPSELFVFSMWGVARSSSVKGKGSRGPRGKDPGRSVTNLGAVQLPRNCQASRTKGQLAEEPTHLQSQVSWTHASPTAHLTPCCALRRRTTELNAWTTLAMRPHSHARLHHRSTAPPPCDFTARTAPPPPPLTALLHAPAASPGTPHHSTTRCTGSPPS